MEIFGLAFAFLSCRSCSLIFDSISVFHFNAAISASIVSISFWSCNFFLFASILNTQKRDLVQESIPDHKERILSLCASNSLYQFSKDAIWSVLSLSKTARYFSGVAAVGARDTAAAGLFVRGTNGFVTGFIICSNILLFGGAGVKFCAGAAGALPGVILAAESACWISSSILIFCLESGCFRVSKVSGALTGASGVRTTFGFSFQRKKSRKDIGGGGYVNMEVLLLD